MGDLLSMLAGSIVLPSPSNIVATALIRDDVTRIVGNPQSPGCQANNAADSMHDGYRQYFFVHAKGIEDVHGTKIHSNCPDGNNNAQLISCLQSRGIAVSGQIDRKVHVVFLVYP